MKNKGKFIFVGGVYDVEVIDVPSDVDKLKRTIAYGQLDTRDQIVRLYSFPKRDAVRRTLFHEVFHLIVDFISSTTFDPPDVELDQAADLWYDFLARNGLIVKNWGHIIPTEQQNE